MSARLALFRVTSEAELERIFRTHVSAKPATGRDGMSPDLLKRRWKVEAPVVRRKLRNGSYSFAAYKQLLVSKGAGQSPRVLSIPTVRDRVALKALAEVVLDVFPEARTRVPQALVGDVMRDVGSGRYSHYARLDIQKFYPSVQHGLLKAALETRIRSVPVLALLMAAVATPTLGKQGTRISAANDVGVPQGLAISNLLAEITFQQIDIELAALPGVSYFRYVDDILILSNSDPAKIFVIAESAIAARSFKAHPLGNVQKSAVGKIDDGIDYLGYQWNGTVWGVRASSRQRVLDSIAREFSHSGRPRPDAAGGTNTAALVRRVNLTITGCIYERHARGWMHFYAQLGDLDTLRSLDRAVRKLAKRHGVAANLMKSFERTYWLIRHPDARSKAYIPDFDRFSPAEMRQLLQELYPERKLDQVKSPELERMFRAEVSRIVSQLERDVGELS